jgi:O-antigen/teichoic acid export membrane protein
MSAEQIYRLLLRAYPPDFRAEYGREMVLLFRDQCRESDVRTIGFWAAVIWDVARSAPALRVEAWRENTKPIEVIMKLAAILTVLIGLLGIVNAVVEWSAGGNGSSAHALALLLAVFASILLLAAGAAILRPSPRGRQAARLAVLASLVLIVAARLLHPWMSILAQLVGIGMPVVLLIALYWPRRSSPAAAS